MTHIPRFCHQLTKAGVQVRKMTEYEPDLEDIFLLIMDKLGEEVRETGELMTSEHMGDGYDFRT